MPLEDLLQLAAHAMNSTEFLGTSPQEPGVLLVSAARLALATCLSAFILLWLMLEARMRREISATGTFGFGITQTLKAYLLAFALAPLLDGNMLMAAFGTSDPLLASRAMDWIRTNPLPELTSASSVRMEEEIAILTAASADAFGTILHGLATLGVGVALIVGIASAKSGPLARNHSQWIGMAMLLGLLGWPGVTDGAAWAALRGEPALLLARLMGV